MIITHEHHVFKWSALEAVALPKAQRPGQRSAVEPDGILWVRWDDQMVSGAPTTEPATPTVAPTAVDPPRFVGIVHSECDEHTLEDLARRFGVSRSHECDTEKGRRGVSAERAARWARILGYPEALS
jgi:hypothetical protein